eukprot:8284197-Pyramimonas_sp.AAC.1
MMSPAVQVMMMSEWRGSGNGGATKQATKHERDNTKNAYTKTWEPMLRSDGTAPGLRTETNALSALAASASCVASVSADNNEARRSAETTVLMEVSERPAN